MPPPGAFDPQAAKAAEEDLWSWYLEWSGIARVAIRDRRMLRALGLLRTVRKPAGEEQDVVVTDEDVDGWPAARADRSDAAGGLIGHPPLRRPSRGSPAGEATRVADPRGYRLASSDVLDGRICHSLSSRGARVAAPRSFFDPLHRCPRRYPMPGLVHMRDRTTLVFASKRARSRGNMCE